MPLWPSKNRFQPTAPYLSIRVLGDRVISVHILTNNLDQEIQVTDPCLVPLTDNVIDCRRVTCDFVVNIHFFFYKNLVYKNIKALNGPKINNILRAYKDFKS